MLPHYEMNVTLRLTPLKSLSKLYSFYKFEDLVTFNLRLDNMPYQSLYLK